MSAVASLPQPEEGEGADLPGTEIVSRWVLVTPARAQQYLDVNTANRTLREKHIERLTDDMKEDRFFISHQGIAFDTEGAMIDGQHRCHAIIESGKPQWVLLTLGLDPIVKRVIDGGAKRRAHDFMPGHYKAIRAAGIRIMLAIEYNNNEFTTGSLGFAIQQITSAAVQEAWDDFDNIEELSGMALEAAKNVPVCGPAGLLVAALCYPDTALAFLTGLKFMTGLESGDPRLSLLRFRGGPKRIQSSVAAFLAIKAAKAFNQGRQINVLRQSGTERLKI